MPTHDELQRSLHALVVDRELDKHIGQVHPEIQSIARENFAKRLTVVDGRVVEDAGKMVGDWVAEAPQNRGNPAAKRSSGPAPSSPRAQGGGGARPLPLASAERLTLDEVLAEASTAGSSARTPGRIFAEALKRRAGVGQ